MLNRREHFLGTGEAHEIESDDLDMLLGQASQHLTKNTKEDFRETVERYLAEDKLVDMSGDRTSHEPFNDSLLESARSRVKEEQEQSLETLGGHAVDLFNVMFKKYAEANGYYEMLSEFKTRATSFDDFQTIGKNLKNICEKKDALQEGYIELGKSSFETYQRIVESHERFMYLIDGFSANTDLIAEAVRGAKIQNVIDMCQKIIDSPKPPSDGDPNVLLKVGRALFKASGGSSTPDAWDASKRALFTDELPDNEAILNDIFTSGAAWYRRALYGSREMRLDSGFESDSTDQVDSYQKRYYETLQNSEYYIALSPYEAFANEMSQSIFDEFNTGKVGQYMDQKMNEDVLKLKVYSRRRFKDAGAATYTADKYKELINGYRIEYERTEKIRSEYSRAEDEGSGHVDDSTSASQQHTSASEANHEEPAVLSPVIRKANEAIKALLGQLFRRKLPEIKTEDMLQEYSYVIQEVSGKLGENVDADILVKKSIIMMIAKFHPDGMPKDISQDEAMRCAALVRISTQMKEEYSRR